MPRERRTDLRGARARRDSQLGVVLTIGRPGPSIHISGCPLTYSAMAAPGPGDGPLIGSNSAIAAPGPGDAVIRDLSGATDKSVVASSSTIRGITPPTFTLVKRKSVGLLVTVVPRWSGAQKSSVTVAIAALFMPVVHPREIGARGSDVIGPERRKPAFRRARAGMNVRSHGIEMRDEVPVLPRQRRQKSPRDNPPPRVAVNWQTRASVCRYPR